MNRKSPNGDFFSYSQYNVLTNKLTRNTMENRNKQSTWKKVINFFRYKKQPVAEQVTDTNEIGKHYDTGVNTGGRIGKPRRRNDNGNGVKRKGIKMKRKQNVARMMRERG